MIWSYKQIKAGWINFGNEQEQWENRKEMWIVVIISYLFFIPTNIKNEQKLYYKVATNVKTEKYSIHLVNKFIWENGKR